jgi:hypothetical protein
MSSTSMHFSANDMFHSSFWLKNTPYYLYTCVYIMLYIIYITLYVIILYCIYVCTNIYFSVNRHLGVILDSIFWLLWIMPQWTLMFNCITEWISLWHFHMGIWSTVSLFIPLCAPFSSSPHEPGHHTQVVQHLGSYIFVCVFLFMDIDSTYSKRHVIFVFLSMVYFT